MLAEGMSLTYTGMKELLSDTRGEPGPDSEVWSFRVLPGAGSGVGRV